MRRVFVVALILGVLAFAAWRALERARGARVAAPAPADTAATAGVRAVRLYFGSADGDTLVVEVRELRDVPSLRERAALLVAELDRGPRGDGVAVLPAGTAVRQAFLDDGGLLTLDLSRSFVQGFRGGSRAEWLAVASLVRTLGDNLPEVRRVRIVAGGAAVASLAGHVPLDRPLDVADWP